MEYENKDYAALLSTCPKDRHDWHIVGVPSCLEFVQEDVGTILGYFCVSEENTDYSEL
jgi:hypothetical protein